MVSHGMVQEPSIHARIRFGSGRQGWQGDDGIMAQRPDGFRLQILRTHPSARASELIRRKAEVVAPLEAGLLTIDEECERNSLTMEELALWQSSGDRLGMQGLRVTRIQHYRDK